MTDPAPELTSSGTGGRHLARNSAIVVGVLLLGLVAFLATRTTSSKTAGRIVGQAAPQFSGTTLDGSEWSLDLHRGNWVVVNFFATWCTECRLENDELQSFAISHEDDPVDLVSVAFSDDAASIRMFWEQNRNVWPVIPNGTGVIALDYGVGRVPESYVISPSGLVVAGFFGGVTAEGLDRVIAEHGGLAAAAVGS